MNSPSNKRASESVGLDCQQIEERIHDLLDQRQSLLDDRIVKEHCDRCRACGDLIADFDALGDSLLCLPVDTGQRDSNFNPLVLVASISALLLVMLTSNAWLPNPAGSEALEVAAANTFVTPVVEMSDPVRSVSLFEITEIAEIAEIKEIAAIVEVVELADNAISSDGLLNSVHFERIGNQVETYHEYLGVTAELPGIESISDSVNLAIQFFSTISRNSVQEKTAEALPDGLNVGMDVLFSICASA